MTSGAEHDPIDHNLVDHHPSEQDPGEPDVAERDVAVPGPAGRLRWPAATPGPADPGLVVGVGLRAATTAAEVLAAVADGCVVAGVAGAKVAALATRSDRAAHPAVMAAADRLGCGVRGVAATDLAARPVDHVSPRVLRLTGRPAPGETGADGILASRRAVGSVAEAAARTCAGPEGAVLLSRHVSHGCVVSVARPSTAIVTATATATDASAGASVPDKADVVDVADEAEGGPQAVAPAVDASDGGAGADRDRVDLDHHGDAEVGAGLLDFAVNVAVARPPDWLAEVLREAVDHLAAYPDERPARAGLARSLGVDPTAVLLLNGAAQGFGLLARARPWVRPLVVHPQFTEPEAALRDAGHDVTRHVLAATDGFRLHAGAVDAGADLVVLGNPTNPTSRLHPRSDVLALCRPGRLVVVDEAFMDVVPGEAESVRPDAALRPGLLVLRSLTKTFGLAGLRAGYAVGHPDEVARLEAVRSPWSVNTLALAAVRACSEPGTRSAAAAAAHVAAVIDRVAADRARLAATLTRHGLAVTRDAAAPFVLARHPGAGELRARLRERGVAVRRGDTFPGLDDTWLRFAVRDAATVARLDEALRHALAPSSSPAAPPTRPRSSTPTPTQTPTPTPTRTQARGTAEPGLVGPHPAESRPTEEVV